MTASFRRSSLLLLALFAGSPQELVADENVRRLYLGESFTL